MYEVSYNAKDLILYALSLGMKSNKDDIDELKFVYENDLHFRAFPTFCLALTFFADRQSSKNGTQGIPSFPPPLMVEEQIIPRKFLRDSTIDVFKFPVIHTWQSVCWHSRFPVPEAPEAASARHSNQVKIWIDLKTISVQPKSIGTFVTTTSKVTTTSNHHMADQDLCTMQATTLILGIPPDRVLSFDAGIPRRSCEPEIPKHVAPIFQWSYQTTESQALLYRLASGDSNRIHVDTSASEMLSLEKKAPLLHGLFTLALALRAIVKLTGDSDIVPRRLEGKFSRPAFVGDNLCVKVWNAIGSRDRATLTDRSPVDGMRSRQAIAKGFFFVVVNKDTQTTLVDCGYAEIEATSAKKTASRL